MTKVSLYAIFLSLLSWKARLSLLRREGSWAWLGKTEVRLCISLHHQVRGLSNVSILTLNDSLFEKLEKPQQLDAKGRFFPINPTLHKYHDLWKLKILFSYKIFFSVVFQNLDKGKLIRLVHYSPHYMRKKILQCKGHW